MEYRVCNNCVMDNSSDDIIVFYEDGSCSYCNNAIKRKDNVFFPNEEGRKKLETLMDMLKEKGKGKKYDCIMGLSGGLDSSYLAYLGFKYGLRILAIHIDDGLDTEIAIENNKKISKACNLELKIESPDSIQYYDLVKAFIKAGVPNIAIPQDNLIFGYMSKYAREYDVKYFLSGYNFALESILQNTNTHDPYDKPHILEINRIYGNNSLNKLHITSQFRRLIIDRIHGIKIVSPLNYIDYNRNRAIEELKNFCGYNYYGGKHYESIFTRFMQTYYLPKKFGVDKRRSHLSSMIISGQMSREEALLELKKPLYNEAVMEGDIKFILDKIQLSREEFDLLMHEKPRNHTDYKTYSKIQLLILKILRMSGNKFLEVFKIQKY